MSPNAKGSTRKLADGTKVFEVNNKILFVRGSFKNPIIEFVVAFNAQNATETEIIEDICFERLNYGNFTVDGLTGWFKARTAYYGEEYFVCYRRENFSAASAKEKRTVKRAALPDGIASFGYSRESDNRRGSNKDDSGKVSGIKKHPQQVQEFRFLLAQSQVLRMQAQCFSYATVGYKNGDDTLFKTGTTD